MAIERTCQRIEDAFIHQVVERLRRVQRHDKVEAAADRGIDEQGEFLGSERVSAESGVCAKYGACTRLQRGGEMDDFSISAPVGKPRDNSRNRRRQGIFDVTERRVRGRLIAVQLQLSWFLLGVFSRQG